MWPSYHIYIQCNLLCIINTFIPTYIKCLEEYALAVNSGLSRELDWGDGYMGAKSLQSCPTPRDPMDCSLPGSSVHGILQARILEWVAMPSSRGSPGPRD